LFKKVDENLALAGHREVDLIVGGPPCQAYSLVGRARDKYRMKDDPRNYMYRFYADFLRKYKPKVFIFENVMGLLSAGEGNSFWMYKIISGKLVMIWITKSSMPEIMGCYKTGKELY
jgi:Site-specific DNA methylase